MDDSSSEAFAPGCAKRLNRICTQLRVRRIRDAVCQDLPVIKIHYGVQVHRFLKSGKIRDIFKQMPDSLVPYLSQNDRLDFIDFMDSNMKAEVTNMLGGKSEMIALADDSLSIRMNPSLKTDMLLLPLAEPVDSFNQVVVVIETFYTDCIYGESNVFYYAPTWQLLKNEPILSEDQKQRIQKHTLQNLFKRDEDFINKH